MEFLQLTPEAQKHAYQGYVKAMDDDLNRDHVVSMEAYGQEANWDGLDFDADGNAIP